MRRTRENELSYIDGIIRGVGEKMWRGRRKGDGSIGKVIGDKEGGIVGMLADSLVPIHPVFSIRPSFSCPTKFTTRFSFLTIAPLPFFCGILGKISMHDGPPHFFRRATIEEERTFQGVKVSREIHPAAKFSLCFDDSLSTCIVDVENFFCFFCFVYDSSLRFFSFFLWFNFFKWYTREEDSSREEMTNEISYFLEMKRI